MPSVRTAYSCFILFLFSSLAWCSCPSQKQSRKVQRARLEGLTQKEVIAEASYNGLYNYSHWFVVKQVWTKNNGNLRRKESVYVNASGERFEGCFKKMEWGVSYILILNFISSPNNTFRPVAPPVLSNKKRFRQSVWDHLCAHPGADSSSCEMRITLPERVVFFQGQIKRLECKVESSSQVVDVQWFKDGGRIETDLRVSLVLNTRAKDSSFLTFNKASQIHRGSYKCLVRNKAGEMKFASTYVDIVGPVSQTHGMCDNQEFCMHGGTCRKLINGVLSCECPKTYEGERCENLRDAFLISEKKYEHEFEEVQIELFHVTTALTALAITLAFVLIFSLVCISRLRRKLSDAKDLYYNDNEDEEKRVYQDSHRIVHEGGCVAKTGTPTIQISVSEPSHPIEFRPVRVLSDDTSVYTSTGDLRRGEMTPRSLLNSPLLQHSSSDLQRGELTPRTMLNSPMLQHSSGNLLISGSISPCSRSPSVRRERLKGRSYKDPI